MKSRSLTLFLCLIFAALIGSAIFYLNSRHLSPATTLTAVATDPTALARGVEGKMEVVTATPKPFTGRLSDLALSDNAFSSNPPRDPAEDEVIKIAADYQAPDKEKIEQLLAMVPRLPEDAKVLAVENAAALIKDEEYLSYRSRLFQLSQSAEMRQAVMHDALTRGEELRLPTLVDMLGSAKSEEEGTEIREILEAYLEKDYGPNPLQWAAPVKKWVAANSDE